MANCLVAILSDDLILQSVTGWLAHPVADKRVF